MEMPESGGTWLEVALNGPWPHSLQPRMPVAVKDMVEEGIACVEAGAAIVQVYAYDESTGRPTQDANLYAAVIEGIRHKVDAIVYPAMPPSTGGALGSQQRFAHIEELARRGIIEWAGVDPGSFNFALYDELIEDKPGFVHLNREEEVRHALKLAMRHRFHPSFGIYEPGFVRLGASLHWRESCPAPVYRFMFSTGCTFSFPPEDYAMTAYLKLLDQVAPGAQWMVAGAQVDVLPMIPRTLAEGGHVRVGLADALFGCEFSNLELVERAAAKIIDVGGDLANAEAVRVAISPEEHEAV